MNGAVEHLRASLAGYRRVDDPSAQILAGIAREFRARTGLTPVVAFLEAAETAAELEHERGPDGGPAAGALAPLVLQRADAAGECYGRALEWVLGRWAALERSGLSPGDVETAVWMELEKMSLRRAA